MLPTTQQIKWRSFLSPTADKIRRYGGLIEKVNITNGFIACPFTFPKFATSNGTPWGKRFHSSYLKGFARLMAHKRIRMTYIASAPIEEEHETIITQAGGIVVETPLLLSANNVVGTAVRECKKAGKAMVELFDSDTIIDITVADIVTNRRLPQRVQVVGTTTNNLRATIEAATANIQCDLTFRSSPHLHDPGLTPKTIVKVTGKSNAIADFVKQKFAVKPSQPYLSFVVVGRHDNFSGGFETRVHNFLDSIGKSIERAPLADIELVFVDYATPSH
jgi:hypothetical protein